MKKMDFEGATVEEGANWIHSTVNEETGLTNPVYTLAQAVNLNTIDEGGDNESYVVLDPQNGGLDVTEKYNSAWEIMDEARTKLM